MNAHFPLHNICENQTDRKIDSDYHKLFTRRYIFRKYIKYTLCQGLACCGIESVLVSLERNIF